MQPLNSWPAPELAPWPPPADSLTPTELSRRDIRTVIFKRTMKLSILGGMGMGALCVVNFGPLAAIAIPLGAIVGLPLGVLAGTILSIIGALLLRPYRGPAIPIVTISVLASCLVTAYLGFGLHSMSAMGAGEGPQSADGPSWDFLFITAWFAATFLSPWLVWWYVKLMEHPSHA